MDTKFEKIFKLGTKKKSYVTLLTQINFGDF